MDHIVLESGIPYKSLAKLAELVEVRLVAREFKSLLSRAGSEDGRQALSVDEVQQGPGHLVGEAAEVASEELLVRVDLLGVEDDLVHRVVPVGTALDHDVGEELVLQGRQEVEVCIEAISREGAERCASESGPAFEAQDESAWTALPSSFPLYKEFHNAALPGTKPGIIHNNQNCTFL